MGFATPRKKASQVCGQKVATNSLFLEDTDEEKQKQDSMLSEADPCKAWWLAA